MTINDVISGLGVSNKRSVNDRLMDTLSNPSNIHPYYHFHGFAGNQIAGDGKFFDLSGINHGVRGDNLSDSQMFANAGYVSTVDPATGVTDSVLRIPSVNFDYAGGEKLLVYWLGKCTAEGSGSHMIGDGYSTSNHGWMVLANSNQKFQIVVSGATQAYSGQSNVSIYDGTLHSFAFVLDGEAKKYAFWIDEVIDPLFSADGYRDFGSGVAFDTTTTNTVNIGSASAKPGGTQGIATSTRVFVIFRFPAGYTVPSISQVESVIKQLRVNPSQLISPNSL